MNKIFMEPSSLNTAVLFIVFNRPDTTAQVFQEIRRAKPPRLYVAADGPREGREGEAERVANVRKIATAVDWPCELKTQFRTDNAGCHFGVREGIDWFFQNEEYGIILEDDCLPSQSFFWFCQEILERYGDDDLIMAVTGTNITKEITFKEDYFFSKYALMWGWATWRRAWKKYDPELSDWATLKKKGWLKSLNVGGFLFENTWSRTFDLTVGLGNNVTWWDYQWIYSCWINNGLTVAPAKNLIRNIGYSAEATHTKYYHRILANLQLNELHWPLREPPNYSVHSKADAFISKHWFGVEWKWVLIDSFKMRNTASFLRMIVYQTSLFFGSVKKF